jgi:hypothetical protein
MQPILEHQKPRGGRATPATASIESLSKIGARMATPLLDYLRQSYLRQSYLRHAAPNRNAMPATIASVV